MNEPNETNQTNPINIEPGTVTLFLHLPIHIAKELLDKVSAGVAASPSSALLEELYTGSCVGTGPRPDEEIEGCLIRIETRLVTPERLAAIRSKIAQPAPPQPKPEPVKVPEPKPAPKSLKLPDNFIGMSTQQKSDWLKAHSPKSWGSMSNAEKNVWTEQLLFNSAGDLDGEQVDAFARSLLPSSFLKMSSGQKDFYIRDLCDQPGGKACLRRWLGTGRRVGLIRSRYSDGQKTAWTKLISILGPKPTSSDDERVEEIRTILAENDISLKE